MATKFKKRPQPRNADGTFKKVLTKKRRSKKSALTPRSSKPVKRNPARKAAPLTSVGADHVAARELLLFLENDGGLYRRMFVPIFMNQQKKWKKGTYSTPLAIKGWLHLVDEAAREYNVQLGTGRRTMVGFDKPTRVLVAQQLEEQFRDDRRTARNPSTPTIRRARDWENEDLWIVTGHDWREEAHFPAAVYGTRRAAQIARAMHRDLLNGIPWRTALMRTPEK